MGKISEVHLLKSTSFMNVNVIVKYVLCHDIDYRCNHITQGLNFQLAAVILSVGVYAYIENSELLHHQ